jgi:lipopolysaccharide transport system ATP-binding protein
MQELAIRVDAICKCYQIYGKPQDRLKQSVLSRLQRLVGRVGKRYFREFWALRNVSLEVRKGETLGIIGRNGSGKSTLLQIICGTLSPTSGNVQINGRVAALLELGSGFNPEFTGRENIFLNAMVLGLTRDQIDQRFEDIVAFADIGDFIEQPVKTYSSGMALRLAFAVIAHVDADILIIDEALAVGDAVFVQKCMRFLRRFKETGTVLFVSHDAGSIVNLCLEALWLDGGEVRMRGPAKDVGEAYSQYCAQLVMGETQLIAAQPVDRSNVEPLSIEVDAETEIDFFDNIVHSEGWSTGSARIVSVEMARTDGSSDVVFAGGEAVVLRIRAETAVDIASPIIGFLMKDRLGQALFGHNTYVEGELAPSLVAGDEAQAQFAFRLPLLPNGEYSITVAFADGDLTEHVQHHWIHDAVLVAVRSPKHRYGLVGIPFQAIKFEVSPRR